MADPANSDPRVKGIRRFHDRLAADVRVTGTILQTVGEKGYDGLAFAVVLGSKWTLRDGGPPGTDGSFSS